MRTVPTLCASSAGIATSVLGFSLVTDAHQNPPRQTPSSRRPDMSLTTTAVFTFSSPSSLPSYTFATPQQPHPRHIAAVGSAPPHYSNSNNNNNNISHNPRLLRSVSDNAARVLSRAEAEPRASLPVLDRAAEGQVSPLYTPQRRTWLRRFSSSMSSSRESSRPPTSRSLAVSQSNGSVAYSNAGSSTPIFSSPITQSLPPNKLVKRSSSLRSDVKTSPSSRLPLPTFRRPATSHQRTSVQLEQQNASRRVSDDATSDASRDPQWKLYFTSKLAQGDRTSRRRHSTSIPNPIKRIYPDRRYQPTLVSAREAIGKGHVEYDDGFSSTQGSMSDLAAADFASSVASSPMLSTTSQFEQAPTAKRSYSIGDLLATGPQPRWRPTNDRASKALRRSRRRVSPTHNDMGSIISVAAESDRPTKRRGLAPTRSLYSSSSAVSASTTPVDADHVARHSSDILSSQSRSSSGEQRRVPSSTVSSQSQKGTRLSTATSEVTSGADSDSEYRSFGDTNTDYQSDTLFDSIPTRTTRSSSGRRGPPIDTIFDETPPSFSSGRSTKLKDFLTQDSFVAMDSSHRYSTIEEEESVSTPVRSVRDRSIASSPTARAASRALFTSSPPTMREMPDPDEIDWDAPDDVGDVSAAFASHSITTQVQHRLPLRFAPTLQQPESTPKRYSGISDRATIFDWSEAQPSPSHNQSPPRPRTVHGKKDPENRGSRPTARRPVSGMHARSHSVPAVPDSDGKRNNAANKFGTWGVGSKAVTEDWNEDFDFEPNSATPESSAAAAAAAADKRIDSGHEFLVPRSIREQQQNVVANIGLLREWGLLIEELKELRRRAAANDMLCGSYAQAWEEVDAMIELADQESEEHTLAPRRSPPSSPGFDYSAFEDPVPDLPPSMALGPSARFPEPTSPIIAPTTTVDTTPVPATPTRPRKDSEAVARSVIEALRTRRTVSDSDALQPVPTTRKVPFDTATLRHIVPYVNALKRKVKDALRETEGLYKSPSTVRHHSAAQQQQHESTDDDDDGFGEELDDDGALGWIET